MKTMTYAEIKKCDNMHFLPKSIHVNKGVILDFRLSKALGNPDPERDYKYDFDVYLPKYGINLQRDYVWEHCQQNEFILSLLLEKPVQPIVIVQHWKNDRSSERNAVNYVIDGKQRLMTIQKFLHDEFPIVVNGSNVYYNEFDDELKRHFNFKVNDIVAWIYYSYENNEVTDDMKIILFNYYNFAGTPQTEEHKNKLQSLLKH